MPVQPIKPTTKIQEHNSQTNIHKDNTAHITKTSSQAEIEQTKRQEEQRLRTKKKEQEQKQFPSLFDIDTAPTAEIHSGLEEKVPVSDTEEEPVVKREVGPAPEPKQKPETIPAVNTPEPDDVVPTPNINEEFKEMKFRIEVEPSKAPVKIALPSLDKEDRESFIENIREVTASLSTEEKPFTMKASQEKSIKSLLDAGFLFNDVDTQTDLKKDMDIFQVVELGADQASINPMGYFNGLAGFGKPIKVFLLNSGAMLLFRYPTVLERKNFWSAIEKMDNLPGSILNNIHIDSVEKYRVVNAIMDLAEELLIGSNVKGISIKNDILYSDVGAICIAIIKTMYPVGLDITIPCGNGNKLDKYGKQVCAQTLEGKIDPLDMVYVDGSKIHTELRRLFENPAKDAITIEEYKAVHKMLPTIQFKSETTPIVFNFKTGVIQDYLNVGKAIEEKIVKLAMDSFDEDVSEEMMTIIEFSMSNGIQAIHLESIEDANTNIKMENKEELASELLHTILNNEELNETYTKGITHMIKSNPVTIGIPKYTCGCGHTQGGLQSDDLLVINPVRLLVWAVMINL